METMILRYPKVWVIDPSPHKKKMQFYVDRNKSKNGRQVMH